MATVDNTLGAGLIGMVVSAAMYGVTTVQAYTYSRGCETDSALLKSTILVLWLLDTTHQILITHAIYWYAVTEFGNAIALASPVWSIIASMPIFAFMQSIIRIIFCVRIWNISSKMDRLAHWRKYAVISMILLSSIGELGRDTVMRLAIAHRLRGGIYARCHYHPGCHSRCKNSGVDAI